MKSILQSSVYALATAACLVTTQARAQRPADLTGTTWTLQANRTTAQLVINTQGGAGAPGAAVCQHIDANLNTTPDIKATGWYCPATGRIYLVHRNLDSKIAVRVFTGNVSDQVIGQPLYMVGTMTVLISAFGDVGEYNFSAVKQ
ncbi:MAG: hypothetical protein LH480_01350 [Rubrivivax sp.]|nr:hypothetical protein [Rubrivivax sp.]